MRWKRQGRSQKIQKRILPSTSTPSSARLLTKTLPTPVSRCRHGDTIEFKIDTGAQTNMILTAIYKSLKNPPTMSPPKEKLIGYSGKSLDVKGTVKLKAEYKGSQKTCTFHIVDTHQSAQPILGLEDSLQLNLIKLILSVDANKPLTYESVTSDYSHLFTVLGEIDGEINLHLNDNVPRSTPLAASHRQFATSLKQSWTRWRKTA